MEREYDVKIDTCNRLKNYSKYDYTFSDLRYQDYELCYTLRYKFKKVIGKKPEKTLLSKGTGRLCANKHPLQKFKSDLIYELFFGQIK